VEKYCRAGLATDGSIILARRGSPQMTLYYKYYHYYYQMTLYYYYYYYNIHYYYIYYYYIYYYYYIHYYYYYFFYYYYIHYYYYYYFYLPLSCHSLAVVLTPVLPIKKRCARLITKARMQTQNINNQYVLPFIATMVTRTRLNVTLIVHCRSCNLHLRYFGVMCNASRRFLSESVIMTHLCRNMYLNTYRTVQTKLHFEYVLLTYTKHIQHCTSVPFGCPTVLFSYTHCAPACNRSTEF